MTIRGRYEPKTSTIGIDLRSHLFEDTEPITFHEMTHFWLAKYTNHGAVYSILNEILLNPHELKVDHRVLTKTASILHQIGYETHEGFAHFMQARKLFEDGGMDAVKTLEDNIPHEAKATLSYLRFAVSKTSEFCNDLTGKLTRLAMNTNLHLDILFKKEMITNHDLLVAYLKEQSNSPDHRFRALTQTIEKKPELLSLRDEEICLHSGITYYRPISPLERANLINTFKALTTNSTNLTEKDIRVLSGPEEVFMPGFESLIIGDANMLERAVRNHAENFYLSESRNFRSIFVFNSPETPVPSGKFGFFAFSGRNRVVNGRFDILTAQEMLSSDSLTKVVDTHSFDYRANSIKPDRAFVGANIVWYKNFRDFEIFLEMLRNLKLKVKANYVAFTEKHNYWFYIFKTSDNENMLHILTSLPFVAGKLEAEKGSYEIEKPGFFDLIRGNEIHLNNFYHDILGLPYQFDVVEMARDTEKYLENAKRRLKSGIGPYELCLCGSGRKNKWCHKV